MTNQPFYEVDRMEQILTGIARVTNGGKVSLDNLSEIGDFLKDDVPTLLELVGEARELISGLLVQERLNHELDRGDAA